MYLFGSNVREHSTVKAPCNGYFMKTVEHVKEDVWPQSGSITYKQWPWAFCLSHSFLTCKMEIHLPQGCWEKELKEEKHMVEHTNCR